MAIVADPVFARTVDLLIEARQAAHEALEELHSATEGNTDAKLHSGVADVLTRLPEVLDSLNVLAQSLKGVTL